MEKKRLPELEWLEDFSALANTQNFSRAEELRRINQPAFSRRMQMLEKRVGTTLFQHQARCNVLTPAGDQFRSHAKVIVRNLTQVLTSDLMALSCGPEAVPLQERRCMVSLLPKQCPCGKKLACQVGVCREICFH